jgi:hypothetical protein
MPNIPYVEPFNVYGPLSRVGQIIGEAPGKAVKAYYRGKEFEEESEIRGLKKEKIGLELEEYRKLAEKKKLEKEEFEKYREDTARWLLGDEGYLALEGKDGKATGEWKGGTKNMPYKDTLLLARRVLKAETKDKVDEIVGNLAAVVSKQLEVKRKYGDNIKLEETPISADRFVFDKNGTINYAEDYGKILDKQVQNWRDEGLPKQIEMYVNETIKNKQEPNQDDFLLKHGLNDSDVIRDEGMMNYIGQVLEEKKSIKDREGREKVANISVGKAQRKEERETRKDKRELERRNDDVYQAIKSDIEKEFKKGEKAGVQNFRTLVSTDKYLDPTSTDKFTGEQQKIIKEAGDKIDKLEEILKIPALANQEGDEITYATAEKIYEEAIKGQYSTPFVKKYAKLLGFDVSEDVAEMEAAPQAAPKTEMAPQAAPKAEAAPQAAPKAGAQTDASKHESKIRYYMEQGLTEQEAQIKYYMDLGYTREQIIEAMKREGQL